jgi:flagellar basal body-associated protein FliL
LKKLTVIVLILTLTVLALVFSPLTFSRSNEPCTSCHSSKGYHQYLDILEGDRGNQLPSTLNVNQTVTVKVVIQNEVNSPIYTDIGSVSLTLRSTFGHFQVSNPTYSVGTLKPGTATATWQITATSEGYDYLDIQASGYNSHYSAFSDAYSPAQLLTVGSPTGTPPPFPTPTPPTYTPTPSQPSSTPAPTSTVNPTNTPSTTNQQTPSPSTTQTAPSTQTTLPTQTTTPDVEEPEAFDWTIIAILAVVAFAVLGIAVFVVIKMRAKKPA